MNYDWLLGWLLAWLQFLIHFQASQCQQPVYSQPRINPHCEQQTASLFLGGHGPHMSPLKPGLVAIIFHVSPGHHLPQGRHTFIRAIHRSWTSGRTCPKAPPAASATRRRRSPTRTSRPSDRRRRREPSRAVGGGIACEEGTPELQVLEENAS